MGLDVVEFIMAVEEAFGIAISDSEAQLATTPGKVADLIMKKVGTTEKSQCLSSRAFYLLRRCTTNELEIPRKMLRPDTPLREIVPERNRKESWEKLKKAINASVWPELRLSQPMVHLVILLVSGLTIIAAVLSTWAWQNSILTVVAVLATAILAGWASATATRPLRTAFPPGYINLGDLARFIVARNPSMLEPGEPSWTRERVWCVLRAVIVEQTGVTDFTEDSHFIKDMHIDDL